ncbi:MAG: glycosyltransferase family 2 protein [Actinomycetota bacterium]|nr:glycosyltransferase family 2 protein [Actinomycetota bacterium]
MSSSDATRSSCTLSVVVVNCNGASELGYCLDSLIDSDPKPEQIILVDNGSSDDSLSVARARLVQEPMLRIISLSRNEGLNVARNIGIENALGDLVAFIDNDAVVKADWIARALETMNEWGADALQCKLLVKSNPGLIDSVGYLIGPFGFPRQIARPGEPDCELLNRPRLLFGAKGAGMIFRKDLLLRIGGFDPSFFLYGDETDLFWRVFRAAGSVALAPGSIVFHSAGGTRRFLSSTAEDLLYRGGTRNYIRMIVKNVHPTRLLWDLLGQIMVWLGVVGYQACRGNLRAASLVLRGIVEGVSEVPRLWSARRDDPLPFRVVPSTLRAALTFDYVRQTARAI